MILTGRGVTRGVAMILLCSLATGCPHPSATPPSIAPTPRTSIPQPKIEAHANPVFRLIVPKRSRDEPSRLVVLAVRVENIHDEPLSIRPDRIRLELPDGSTCNALDRSRAVAILGHTSLARADLYYLDSGTSAPAGGLTTATGRHAARKVREGLLADTRLAPGEAVGGFVIVDTRRRFRSLGNSVVEVNATATEPQPGPCVRFPVRVLLGSPIELTD